MKLLKMFVAEDEWSQGLFNSRNSTYRVREISPILECEHCITDFNSKSSVLLTNIGQLAMPFLYSIPMALGEIGFENSILLIFGDQDDKRMTDSLKQIAAMKCHGYGLFHSQMVIRMVRKRLMRR